MLAQGVAELSCALADGCTLNDATRLALEILYRGLEMQRVLFALRDPRLPKATDHRGRDVGERLARTDRAFVDELRAYRAAKDSASDTRGGDA